MPSSVCFYVKRHGEWRDGVLSVVPHYSVDTIGGDIAWQMSISQITNLTAASPVTTEIVRAAPVTANVITTVDLGDALVSQTSGIDGRHIGVMISIGRVCDSVSDTNTGQVKIYGADLVYKEARRVVGSKG